MQQQKYKDIQRCFCAPAWHLEISFSIKCLNMFHILDASTMVPSVLQSHFDLIQFSIPCRESRRIRLPVSIGGLYRVLTISKRDTALGEIKALEAPCGFDIGASQTWSWIIIFLLHSYSDSCDPIQLDALKAWNWMKLMSKMQLSCDISSSSLL